MYWVKFSIAKNINYGRMVTDYDKKVYKVARGHVPVEDAIFPVYHQVKKKDLQECSCEEYSAHIGKELNKVLKASKNLPKRQIVPGKLFRIVVGDGFAWYIVTKVHQGKKTCDVEHRGFSLDEWYDHYFGSGRENVLISDIKPIII
jgi:hypothetical protein